MTSTDPTKIVLQTNVKKEFDPTIIRMRGYARHGMTPFDVPFISHIEGNLWQGGCQSGLHLPHFFKHVFSMYPWERYKVKKDQLSTEVYIEMFDSLDQSMEQVDAIARLINEAKKTGPVLVHCQAGLNRSSLVAARSLMLDGRTADEAIKLLRVQRSPACLCNVSFEAHLRSL
jgi:dual specificity protein phosphatase-like protein